MNPLYEGFDLQKFNEVTDQEVVEAIRSLPPHFSANLTVDLGNTTQQANSLSSFSSLSGVQNCLCAASGGIIGQSVDMLHSDTFCNMLITGVGGSSGQLRIAVQTSDSDTSGTYTDPTSGLAQLPTVFQSGGIVWLNSGGTGNGLYGAFVSGQAISSGFCASAAFQRPGRFVRANLVSGDFFAGPLEVNFLSQFKTTGSGGGFTYQPTSGTVNV